MRGRFHSPGRIRPRNRPGLILAATDERCSRRHRALRVDLARPPDDALVGFKLGAPADPANDSEEAVLPTPSS